MYPGGHGLRLGLALGGPEGLDLPVQIGHANLVVVNESERAHAGPSQSLSGPAAHAAQAEHGHVGGGKALHGIGAQHHLRAQKLFLHGYLLMIKAGAGCPASRPRSVSKNLG